MPSQDFDLICESARAAVRAAWRCAAGNPAAVVVEPNHRADGHRRIYAADDALAEARQHDGVLPRGSISADATRYVSETGQIELRTEPGTIKVVTARSSLTNSVASDDVLSC